MLNSAERSVVQVILDGFPLSEASVLSRPESNEWEGVTEAAERHGLAPLLFQALKRCGRTNELPQEGFQKLQSAYLNTKAANVLAYQELARLSEALTANPVPFILLKGSALAKLLYPDMALRPFGDLDLLIQKEAVPLLRTLLTDRGYVPLAEMERGFEERFSGQQAYVRAQPPLAQVDVHWHLFVMPYYRERIPMDWFWKRTIDIELDGTTAKTLSPVAQLVHLTAHYSLHHHLERLLWLYDTGMLVNRYCKEINWKEFIEAVDRFGLALPVRTTLGKLSESWGVSLPAMVWKELSSLRPSRDERVLFAMTSGEHSQARVILDGLATSGLRSKLTLIVRHMFPSSSYIRARYRVRNPRMVPLYYIWRIASGGLRAARSLVATAWSGVKDRDH